MAMVFLCCCVCLSLVLLVSVLWMCSCICPFLPPCHLFFSLPLLSLLLPPRMRSTLYFCISISLTSSPILRALFSLVRLAEQLEGQLDPFDDTRVHPECYNTQDWAQRICANALDVQVYRVNYKHVFLRCTPTRFPDSSWCSCVCMCV